MLRLSDKAWSPYAAGIVIGLLQIPAFLIIDTALGASSSYVTVAGHIASVFDSGVNEMAYFSKYMTSTKYFWQLALVIGIAIGALVSMKLSGTSRPPISRIWARAIGTNSTAARSVMAFTGGFVLLFGARLAGGCTSGHGISGLAQFAIGSTLVVAAMFAGGILTASLMRRIA